MLRGEVCSQVGHRNVCNRGWFNSTAFTASISKSQTSISSTCPVLMNKTTPLCRHLKSFEEIKECPELVGKNLERDQLKFSDTLRQWFPSVKRPMLVPVLSTSNNKLPAEHKKSCTRWIPHTTLIEKESVKHFALANSQPQVIHVQVLHIKEM